MPCGIRDHVPALAEGRLLDEASELGIDFYNDLGALTAGTLVYVSSHDPATLLPKVTKADADVAGKGATYVVREAVANGRIGVLVRKMKPVVTSLDTSGAAVGDPVYLSDTAGGITLTSVGSGQVVGRVVTLSATVGKVAFDLEGAGTSGGAATVFFDSIFRVVDDADDTKKMAFQVSGVSAGQTRVLTVPDSDGTLGLLGLAQTWSAKQTFGAGLALLDADTIEFGTGVDVVITPDGTNVVMSAGAGAGAFIAHDSVFLIADPVDATKRARLDAGSVTAGQTRIMTIPDADIGLSGPMYVSTADSTAITGATETKAAFDTKKTISAGVLKAGTTIHIVGWGKHTATTGAETHDISLEIGAAVITSTATVDPANGDVFMFEAWITVRTAGAPGSIVGMGRKRIGAVGTAEVPFVLDATAFDTTIANDVAIYIDRQAAAADADSAVAVQMIVEISG